VYYVPHGKLVVTQFHYVEKGGKNDAALSCSSSATIFCIIQQKAKFFDKNLTKFHQPA
jgi:hypothetical protein